MKTPALRLIFLLSLALDASAVRFARASDDGPAHEATTANRMITEELKRWEIRTDDALSRPAVVGVEPDLRYTNPGVGRVHGSVYLFVAEGRPLAVMSIYKWFSPWTGFEAEVQSLSERPLKATRDGQVVWQPAKPGITIRDVPDAPVPAASAAERLRQMRSIAGGFAGRLVVDSRVASTGNDQTLRLLPKPIYRDEARGSSGHDGGLFAFVLGTDPEVFLRLESSESPQGPRWRYGLARMNSDPLRVTYGGKEVWKVDKIVDRYDPSATYFSKELPQNIAAP